MILRRLSKFGVIGILSTGLHGLVLIFLIRIASQPAGVANLMAFIVAFIFSISAQQAFTFHDRLAGQTLKKRSVAILFLFNALMAYILGAQVDRSLVLYLIFVPSIINFILLHLFSGHPDFKR